MLDIALLQEEFDAPGMSLCSCEVKGGTTVVVTQVHVHSLMVGAEIIKHWSINT